VALAGVVIASCGSGAQAQSPGGSTSAPTELPTVEVTGTQTVKKTTKKKSAAAKKAPTSGQSGAVQSSTATGAGSGTTVGAAINADLGADSVANPYRVAPSSRQHTQTFTQEDIKKLNPTSVFDLLQQATGVLPDYKGRKHVFSLSIRGDANYAFIVDGAYLPSFIGGRILQSLPVSAIEQIEIVRDGGALTLGPLANYISPSSALNSGFIVIRTRRPVKTEVDARAAIESYGTRKASVFTGTTFDSKSINTNNGWYGYVAGSSAYNTTDGPDGWNMWSDSKTVMGKLGLGKGGFFTEAMIYKDYGGFGFERATSAIGNPMILNQKWSYDPIDTMLFSSNTRMSWDKNNTTLLTVSLNEVSQANVQDTFNGAPGTVNYESDKMQNVNLRHRFTYGGTMIELGGQYVHWHSPTGELFFFGKEREEETKSAYFNVEQKLFGDILTLDASGRFDDQTIIKGIDSYGESISGATQTCRTKCAYVYDKDLPRSKSLSVGGTLLLTREITTTARYSRTSQGGVSGIYTDPGVELDGAVMNKWEAGITANYTPMFVPTLTYFDTRIDNDKAPYRYETDPDNPANVVAVWAQANTHRAGIELAVSGTLLEKGFPGKISYSAGWTHLTMYQSTSRDATLDRYFPETQPEDIFNFSVSGEWGPYFANASLNHVSGYLSNFNTMPQNYMGPAVYNPVGDFDVVNASIGRNFDLGDWDSKLTFYGRNLLDQNYSTVNGYPAIGRVLGAELAFTY